MSPVSAILEKEIAKDGSPSVQYLFFDAENILFEHSAGYADLHTGRRVDRTTTFNALSITKTCTALAILKLEENKLISLENPVRYYLPSSVLSEKVKVKHLLNHTSGLANPLPLKWIHLTSEHDNFQEKEFFAPILAKNAKPTHEPGTRFNYSNLGYIYLSRIIESVSGRNYEDFIAQNLFAGLELEEDVLGFKIPREVLHARGYHKKRSGSMLLLKLLIDCSKYMEESIGKWKPFKPYYVNGPSYGGLIASGGGLVKYGQELIKENSRFLSTSLKDLMFTENVDGKGRGTGMCLGWFTGKLGNHRYVTHAGGGGGYYCELRLYPELKLGSFVLFNRSGFSDERYLDKLDVHFINRSGI